MSFWGVAQDHPKNALIAAFCAVNERIASTPHKILRQLAHFAGSLRVGGLEPPFKKENNFKDLTQYAKGKSKTKLCPRGHDAH
jgi:hypothetical protein